MAKQINKKTFDLIVRTRKSFNIYIEGFKFATTLLFRIRDKIRITFISSLIGKMNTVMNLKQIRLVFSQVKLRISATQTINLKKISATYVVRERLKAATILGLEIATTFSSKARQKINTNVSLKKIQLVLTPILATFYTLGNHDSKTLSTMDSQTLGDLDYLTT